MPEKKREVRFCEFETRGSDSELGLVGYAAVFDTPAVIGGMFREIIRPGAFREHTIESGLDVRALYNHDRKIVIGRRSASTLRLSEDDHGLRVEIDLPDNTTGRDIMVSVERGDLREMSFEFYAIEEKWLRGKDDDDLPTRELIAVKTPEVSIVTFPAYETTEIAKRSAEMAMESCPFTRDRVADKQQGNATPRRARAAMQIALVSAQMIG